MSVTRRYFFFGTLLAGAVPRGGFGSTPSLKALGFKSFNDKLNVASIGVGGQGGADLNDAAKTENIVALCDVDFNRGAANLKKFDKPPKYKDFRVMLDKEKNIDAVTIGIPDFMHATVALACMQRGKHVYCEKPLTRTPWEARLLLSAAAKYKVATQMGNQGFSHECNRVAAEIVWSGAIGDVTEAHISTTPGTHPTGLQQLPPEDAVPANLDWELWLGGAAPRPFSNYYVPYNWRGFLDFGTGQIGNWATHTAGPVQTALQLGAPTSLECITSKGKSSITYPDGAIVRLEFPARGEMPPVTVYYQRMRTAARGGRGCVSRAGHGERSHSAAAEQSGGQGASHGPSSGGCGRRRRSRARRWRWTGCRISAGCAHRRGRTRSTRLWRASWSLASRNPVG